MEPEAMLAERIRELKAIEERLHRIRGLTLPGDIAREIIDLQYDLKEKILEAEEVYANF